MFLNARNNRDSGAFSFSVECKGRILVHGAALLFIQTERPKYWNLVRPLKYAYTEGLKMLTFHCVLSYHNVDKNDMKTNAFKFENEFVSMCFSTSKR